MFGLLGGLSNFFSGNLGSSLLGAGLNFLGSERRNSQQMAAASELSRFNAEQAELDRTFQREEAETLRAWSEQQALLSRGFNKNEALKARIFSGRQAHKNRAFAAQMASTQHQRAVSDMRKAGLNPILAAGRPNASPGGSPAGTAAASSSPPAGAAGKGSRAAGAMAQLNNSIGEGLSTGMQLRNLQQTIKESDQRVMFSRAGEQNLRQDYRVKQTQEEMNEASTKRILAEAERQKVETELSAARTISEILRQDELRLMPAWRTAETARSHSAAGLAGTQAELNRLAVPYAQQTYNLYSGPEGEALRRMEAYRQATGFGASGVGGLLKKLPRIGKLFR